MTSNAPINTPAATRANTRERLTRIAGVLDTAWRIPGTRIRFGLDALIGLIPGVGDVAGVVLGLWMLWQARSVEAPGGVQLRMLANLAVEGVVGLVPILGDLFDVYWQANQRNRALLLAWMDQQDAAQLLHATPTRLWPGMLMGLLLVLTLIVLGRQLLMML